MNATTTMVICDFQYKDENGKVCNRTITENACSKRRGDIQMANLAITIYLGKYYPERFNEVRSLYYKGEFLGKIKVGFNSEAENFDELFSRI